jgi:hypothetical protein
MRVRVEKAGNCCSIRGLHETLLQISRFVLLAIQMYPILNIYLSSQATQKTLQFKLRPHNSGTKTDVGGFLGGTKEHKIFLILIIIFIMSLIN